MQGDDEIECRQKGQDEIQQAKRIPRRISQAGDIRLSAMQIFVPKRQVFQGKKFGEQPRLREKIQIHITEKKRFPEKKGATAIEHGEAEGDPELFFSKDAQERACDLR